MSADAGEEPDEFALNAGRAGTASGPAFGGAVGRQARVQHGSPRIQGSLRDRLRRRPAAALDPEPLEPCAPDGAVAGQAPPPGGRADRPTSDELEADVNTIAMQELTDELVDVADLACAGCWGPVVDAPPSGWPVRAGRAPEFSHPDGSGLCPDEQGRVGEPVEAGGLRYGLTEAGATVSLDEARWSP